MDESQGSSGVAHSAQDVVTADADNQVRRLSTEDRDADRELEVMLSQQERMVVHTDQVREDGVTEDSQAPSHTEETSEDERPQVRQFNWSPNQALTMKVPIWIGRRQVMAVVDTAAQVTIISCALSEELGCEPPVEKVQLRNAQQDSWMDGGIHERFGFQLGSRKYYWDVIEADIGDSFIIGIDFLKSVKCKIDLDGNNLELVNGDRIRATMKRNADGEAVHVSRVLLHRKTTIPPKSMKLVKAKLESPAEVPFLLETAESSSVFAVPVMVEGKGPLKVCVVNLGEELVSLQRKQNLATAVEIDAMVDGEDSEETQENDTGGCDVRAVQTGGDTDEGQAVTVECHSESESTLEEQELPEHLRCLYEECRKRLTTEQAKFVRELLIEFADVFATHDLDIGRFTVFAHRIRTGNAMSLRKSMRRTPLGFDHEERKTLKAMLDAKVIEPSQSEWASPPVLVRKKDGSWRYCIDFRGLNAATTRDAYPLPLIEECIDSLAYMQWYSALDMNSGYWQIPVAEEDKEKTAFITKYGLFHFLRMPFGLSNAPATFQRTMNLVLSGLIWVNVIVYLDDVNVIGKTFQENLANLRVVLARFRKYGLKLKPRKCVLFKRETAFLGRRVDSAGVHITDDHVKAVQEWPQPKNRKQVEQFLGFINYHRSFIPDLARITAPLYELTGPKAKWCWGEDHSKAFDKLKEVMTSVTVLGCPRAEDSFILDTDASDFAVGGVLSQVQDGQERPISFASKVLNPAQRDYCTTRKELLAVVVFTRHFRHYLLGPVFRIRTDHASLVWLMRFKHPSGQLARWLMELGQYACVQPDGGRMVRAIQTESVITGDARTDGGQISNYMEQYSFQDLRDKQMRDPDLQPLFVWLEHTPDHVPRDGELRMQSPTTHNLWKHRSQLRWHHGVLQYQWDYGAWKSWLLVVPSPLKEEMLVHCHDAPTGGHLGVSKTLERLRQRCFWYGMTRDVQVYVTTCAECNQNKRLQANPMAPLQCYQAGNPGDRVHMDILGPFLESHRGNKYVLMMVDQFTRWLELQALGVQDAVTVAQAFFESYTVRFGVPFVIHTDQGKNFDSNFFRVFCELLESVKTRTTPYRLSSNGQVERYNQQVLNFLRCFLQGKQRSWDEYLPVLGMALRATVNRNTGFTPNMLQLGREVNMPADVLLGLSRCQELPQSQGGYLKKLLSRMEEVHHQTRQHLRQAQLTQKKYYDLKARSQRFAEGDLVYKRNMGCKAGLSRKLCPLFVGPFIVKVVLPNDLYRVEGQLKEETVHHDRLRRCEDRAIPFWVRRRRHWDEREESVDGDATIIEGVNSDLDETVAFGEDVPEVAGETSMVDEEVSTVDSTEDEPEWNLGALFESTEPDESQRGRVRRRPAYLSDYCT